MSITRALGQAADVLRLLPIGGPSCCNIAVTNVCNATCDFCNYAKDKDFVTEKKWLDPERLTRSLDILHQMARNQIPGYDVRPTLENVAFALRSPDYAPIALEILGRLPGMRIYRHSLKLAQILIPPTDMDERREPAPAA